jgi:hypothetical protein
VRKTVSKLGIAVEDEYGQKSCVECEKSLRTEMPHEHGIQQEVVRDVAQSRSNIVMKNPELRQKSCNKGAFKPHQDRRKHRHDSRKHSYREEKGAVFEGVGVSYLVGQFEAEEAHPSAGNGERTSVQEDDCVLHKLFKRLSRTKCVHLS